jgi:hypothetical protein
MTHTNSVGLSGPMQRLHLIKHNTHKKKPSMVPVGFELAMPGSEGRRSTRGLTLGRKGVGTCLVRRDKFLPSMGIVCGGNPTTAFISPMLPKEICFTDYLVNLFQVNGNVISSIHCAYSHSRVEQVTESLQYYIALLKCKFTSETLWSLMSKFTIFLVRLWNVMNTSRYLLVLIS